MVKIVEHRACTTGKKDQFMISGRNVRGGNVDQRDENNNGIVKTCRNIKRCGVNGVRCGNSKNGYDRMEQARSGKRAAAVSENGFPKLCFKAGKTLSNGKFKIKISTGLAELATIMNGCVCRYIRKKSRVGRITLIFSAAEEPSSSSSSSSDSWQMIISNSTRDHIQKALKLFNLVNRYMSMK